MTSGISRIVVAVAGLPVVLGIVWLGGWWLFVLAAVAAGVALHELFHVTRSLGPLVLAGFVGAFLALLGAELGGPPWMIGGFLTTVLVAFVLKGFAGSHASTTVAVAVTVLAVAWIGLGLAHMILIRDIPVHAQVSMIDGLSAHAGRSDLLQWLDGLETPPAMTWVVHGEPRPASALAAAINDRAGWRAEVARDGATVALAR